MGDVALGAPKKERSVIDRRLRPLLSMSGIGVVIALIVEMAVLTMLNPIFLTPDNLMNIARGAATTGIMAVGMTMVIVSGGLDLSIGSILALSAMVAATAMTNFGYPPFVGVLAGLIAGIVFGSVSGTLIARLRINSFIVTLGAALIGRGLVYLVAGGGSNIRVADPVVLFLGQGRVLGIPVSVYLMVITALVGWLFLRNTALGRQIYAVGGNERAARLAGISVERVRIFVFAAMGGVAGFAGIVSLGTLGSASTGAGTGAELEVIAAVIIGGAALSGGQGSVISSLVGVAIVAVLKNGFVLLGFPLELQTIMIGVVIVGAVVIDSLRHRS